jgi:hypothetical protein
MSTPVLLLPVGLQGTRKSTAVQRLETVQKAFAAVHGRTENRTQGVGCR